MPKYNSLGVTATLSVTPLADTVSDNIFFRMGKEQQREAERITSLLKSGRTLPESPIGTDGTSKVGIMQHLGEHKDMAMFMVEAGDGLVAKTAINTSFPSVDSLQSSGSAFANVETPQSDASFTTALETQPADTPLATESKSDHPNYKATSLKKRKATPAKCGANATPKTSMAASTFGLPSVPPTTPAPTWNAFVESREPLALTLALQYSSRTFLREDRRLTGTGRDLKIDILLNGKLVEVQYESARKSGEGLITKLFSGTRLHRQAEVPWVYSQKTGSNLLTGGVARQRWKSISNDLAQEADARGADSEFQRPLTGDFLIALSQLSLPQRMEAKGASFGVIDIMITAGKGRKYGPETTYQCGPTRMDDTDFKVTNVQPVANPDTNQALQKDNDDSMLYRNLTLDASTSPYFERTRINSQVGEAPLENPTIRRVSETYRRILRNNIFNQSVGSFPNAHGRPGAVRTLKQRVGDMTKMSPIKRQEAYEDLETKVDAEALREVRRALEMEDDAAYETPTQTLYLEPVLEQPEITSFATGVLQGAPEELAGDVTIENALDYQVLDNTLDQQVSFAPGPQNMSAFLTNQAPNPFHVTNESAMQACIDPRLLELPEGADPVALLTQSRMDMALDYGLSSNGALLNRIASTSPQRKPLRRTAASSLTGAPIHVPIKSRPYKRRASASEPERQPSREPSDDATPARKKKTPQRPTTPGSNRTKKSWNPAEQGSNAALEAFEIPDLCVGSAVTYALPGTQRQIKKERSGEFKEETFIVGMRFVVY